MKLFRLSDVLRYREKLNRPLMWLCHTYEDLRDKTIQAECEVFSTKWCLILALDEWIGCIPIIGHLYIVALGLWIERKVFRRWKHEA